MGETAGGELLAGVGAHDDGRGAAGGFAEGLKPGSPGFGWASICLFAGFADSATAGWIAS